MKRLFLFAAYLILLFHASFVSASAETSDTLSDDPMQFALLTCEPGDLIYELYGHTALRYTNRQTGDDWVFNYGLFNFNAPHFVWRFLRGTCDYQLGVIPFYYFSREYQARGSFVCQQVLNLTASEKRKLYQQLVWNSQPENSSYRYNIIYDNCATRVRDRIEEAIDGRVVYAPADTVLTFRQIIHQFTAGHPWSQEGQDLCLGVAADRPATQREAMFAPFYLMRDFASARIQAPDGTSRPLVLSESRIIPGDSRPETASAFAPTPAHVVVLSLLLVLVVLLLEWRYNRMFWGIDVVLMLVQGLAGCVIAFLFFFSEHPTVGSNLQILILHPLALLALFWVAFHAVRRSFTYFHMVRLIWLTFFMAVILCSGQDIPLLTIGMAQVLLLRSVSYILFYRRNHIGKNQKK